MERDEMVAMHMQTGAEHNGAPKRNSDGDVSASVAPSALGQRLTGTVRTIEAQIAEHPAPFLGGSFFLGVMLGWWIKRR